MFHRFLLFLKKNWQAVTLISVVGVVGLLSVILLSIPRKSNFASPEEEILYFDDIQKSNITNENNETNEESYIDSTKFPEQIMAPFVDMVSWVDTSSPYSYNGTMNLEKIQKETGLNYFNLGFIRADDKKPLDSDGDIRWCWGGYAELSARESDGYQYEGIKNAILNVRKNGGDVIVSVGGQLGKAPWLITSDVLKLRDMYIDIIKTYDLKRIDLDIEEGNQGESVNIINARAIKKAQDTTGVEVVLTLPIMPYGWTNTQLNILRAYMNAGVDIKVINAMTMCYGYEVYDNEDFGDASIRALKNANRQLIDIYNEFGMVLSEQDAYKKLGATVDIGYENIYNPVFTPDLTKKVVDFAKEANLAMISYWSLNRDTKVEKNSGVNNQYEFYVECAKFLSNS